MGDPPAIEFNINVKEKRDEECTNNLTDRNENMSPHIDECLSGPSYVNAEVGTEEPDYSVVNVKKEFEEQVNVKVEIIDYNAEDQLNFQENPNSPRNCSEFLEEEPMIVVDSNVIVKEEFSRDDRYDEEDQSTRSHFPDFEVYDRLQVNENPLKCRECNYVATKLSNLKIHIERHKNGKLFKCSECNFYSDRKSKLEVHIRRHTGEKPFKCSECDYCSSVKFYLDVHVKTTHTNIRPYQCTICNFSFTQNFQLKDHMLRHNEVKSFKCSFCDFSAVKKYELRAHIRTHTGEKPFKCSKCDYSTAHKKLLKIHLRNHNGEKPFPCPDCDYFASQKSHLVAHIRTHTGEKPFKCDQCHFTAAVKCSLKRHLMVHVKEKPFKCNECSFSTTIEKSFNTHVQNHIVSNLMECEDLNNVSAWTPNATCTSTDEVEKSFNCDIAASNFSMQLNTIKHSNEGEFKCSECDFSTDESSALNKHLKIHTWVKLHKCPECNFTTAYDKTLKSHLRHHSSNNNLAVKKLKCSLCTYEASNQGVLTRHSLAVHSDSFTTKFSDLPDT